MLLPASVEPHAFSECDGIASHSRIKVLPRLRRPQSPVKADVVVVVAAEGGASAAELNCVEADDSSLLSEHLAHADCSHVGSYFPEESDGSGESDELGLATVTVASGLLLAAASVGAVHS